MQNTKKILLIILTVLWFALVLLRFDVSYESLPGIKSGRDALMADKIAKYAWALPDSQGYDRVKKQLFEEALELYEKSLSGDPKNIDVLSGAAIANYELGQIKECKIHIEKIKKYGFEKQAAVLGCVLIDKCSDRSRPVITGKITNLFSGFRQNQILYYYEICQKKPAGLSSAVSQARRLAFLEFSKYILFVLLIFGLFIIGIVLLALYFFTLKKGKKYLQGYSFFTTGLSAAWTVFIIWDALHLVPGFILRAFNIRITSIFDALLIYIAVSAIALCLVFATSRVKHCKDRTLFCPYNAIGLGSFNAKSIAWGLGGYCAILPINLAAFIINRMMLKEVEVSSNPVFGLLKKIDSPVEYFLLFFMVVILGPAVEEIIFRGYLYTVFRKYFSFTAALLAVSFIFSFIHADFYALVPIFGIGLVLGAVYEYSGSIVSSWIAHALWNMNTFIVFVMLFK